MGRPHARSASARSSISCSWRLAGIISVCAPCTGRSQRLIGEIPGFTSTNPLAQLAVRPSDYLLAHRVRLRELTIGDRSVGLVDDGHGRFCGDAAAAARVVKEGSVRQADLLEQFLGSTAR
jgi:hypothetical protein